MPDTQTNNTELASADALWAAADKLRGQIDAAEYRHVVLGLLFLKYISDSFAARRDELKAEPEADGITGAQLEALLEGRDEYTAERMFWVPPQASSDSLALVAMEAIPGRRVAQRASAVWLASASRPSRRTHH